MQCTFYNSEYIRVHRYTWFRKHITNQCEAYRNVATEIYFMKLDLIPLTKFETSLYISGLQNYLLKKKNTSSEIWQFWIKFKVHQRLLLLISTFCNIFYRYCRHAYTYISLSAHTVTIKCFVRQKCTSSYPSLSYSEWHENLLSTARRER